MKFKCIQKQGRLNTKEAMGIITTAFLEFIRDIPPQFKAKEDQLHADYTKKIAKYTIR